MAYITHPSRTPRGALPCASHSSSSAVLGLQRVVFRYVFWAHSSPSFAADNVFSWPTSLTDRPLSSTEMGSLLSASCQRAPTGGRGHPGSGAHPTQWVSSGVMARTAQGRSEAGLCLRAVSDVQGQEPYRPSMRALSGPGGGQAFLPQASHTSRRGTRPGCGRDEDLEPLPVGRVQPGPQGRCRGALREEVSDEDTSDTRGAGRME
jgi:hypothetical protein